MKTLKLWMVLFLLISWVLAACTPTGQAQSVPTSVPTALPAESKASPPASDTMLGKDPQNATYLIEGQEVTLVNGVAENEIAPGSASKLVTRYFGNELQIDLNSDGLMDTALLLTQESGGSGTFFYVAAALQQEGGYLGTNAIILGDRIAPQSTNVDPGNPLQFIVNYADRKPAEPMSAQPSVGVSKTFKLQEGALLEVPTSPK